MFTKGEYIGWLMAALCMFGQGCSPRAVQEAQAVVAEADSLRMQGQAYSDSAQLAQAYCTLHRRRAFYPDAYAHCCYHYGRLLRAHDDPVAAMQVFINATHSRTRDYAILGRIYSNFGEMAHLAGEFELSYDMFERCGEMFLITGDTVAYCYALNDMAVELAIQGKKEETLALLANLENYCTNEYMQENILMTKAEMYIKCKQFDSVIYCLQMPLVSKLRNPTILLILAQTYSYIGVKDSAVYYANLVLSHSHEPNDINNALYILTNDDETKDITEVRETAADRSDAQKLVEIRHGKLTQAVQLLEQELTRKPDLRWLYAIIITLAIVGTSISIYVSYKHKNHRLLSQKVDELRQAASAIQEKHDDLSTRYTTYHQHVEDEIKSTCIMLRSKENTKTELAWNDYDAMCHIIDQQFYMLASKLKGKNILNETEVRLCVLVLLDMSRAEIAHTLPYALNSIGKLKDHTAKLLGTTGKNLREYLLKMAIEG